MLLKDPEVVAAVASLDRRRSHDEQLDLKRKMLVPRRRGKGHRAESAACSETTGDDEKMNVKFIFCSKM